MFKITLAAAAFALAGAPVLAGDTQTHSRTVERFAYEANVENFCPAGLSPVRYNGVVCCGVPTATGYVDRAGASHAMSRPTYAPQAIPMGKSPDSMDGT